MLLLKKSNNFCLANFVIDHMCGELEFFYVEGTFLRMKVIKQLIYSYKIQFH